MKFGNLSAIDQALQGRNLHYAHNGDDRSAFLRGRPLFEVLQNRYRSSLGLNPPSVTIDNGLTGNGPKFEILFLFTPGAPVIAHELARRHSAGMPVIMDMHADLLRLVAEDAASDRMREAGTSTSREAWEYWWHPDRQEVIRAAIEVVSVITTPWLELVAPLGAIAPCPIVFMPDLDERHPDSFATDFGYALRLATEEKP